jgi:cyclic pyranopterin phosphate synthase
LYDNGILNIKDLIRQGINEDDLRQTLLKTFNQRAKDGWEAERSRKKSTGIHESMATIGG